MPKKLAENCARIIRWDSLVIGKQRLVISWKFMVAKNPCIQLIRANASKKERELLGAIALKFSV